MPTWTFPVDADGLPITAPPPTMPGQELNPSQAVKVEALIFDCFVMQQNFCAGLAVVPGFRVTDTVRAWAMAMEDAKALGEHAFAYVCYRAHCQLWKLKQRRITDPDGPSLLERLEALEGAKLKKAG